MVVNRDASWLQFWHAELNRMYFDGELEPAIVHVKETHSDVFGADFDWALDPYLITFYDDVTESVDSWSQEDGDMALITVMLHEMVHQFIFQNGIATDGEHGYIFKYHAREHGMMDPGYSLSHEADAQIRKRLKSVNDIDGIGQKRKMVV